MRRLRLLTVLIAGLVCTGPAFAADAPPATDIESLQSMVKPADVDLFFNYLREAMKAGMAGKTPPAPPPQLTQRAQELAKTLQQQGAATLDQMLQQFQDEMKKALPPDLPPETAPEAPKEKPSPQPDHRT